MKTKCNNCCDDQADTSKVCGCCEGVEILTPLSTYNRPGLSEINYRIGSHGSFLETMTARLTGYCLEKKDAVGKVYPLKALTTRDSTDPALAMLDAWATVADVLTFYQERIANEGYLRTATERRSVLEMARLVGYKPRPGVAASVFLAYALEKGFDDEVIIPAGSRVQSLSGPDELPQVFETSEDLKARAQWNTLKPRKSRPQSIASIKSSNRVYLKGLNTNLNQNDPLLIGEGDAEPILFWIKDIQKDVDNDRTLIFLGEKEQSPAPILTPIYLFTALTLHPSIPPVSSRKLTRNLTDTFGINKFYQNKSLPTFGASEASHSIIKTLDGRLKDTLAASLSNANTGNENKIRIYALRVKAAPFAHNAPLQPVEMDDLNVMRYSEWQIKNPLATPEPTASFTTTIDMDDGHMVTFNNTSTGVIDSVIWDFGGDSSAKTSGVWSPVHTYTSTGTKHVTLTVTGPSESNTLVKDVIISGGLQ